MKRLWLPLILVGMGCGGETNQVCPAIPLIILPRQEIKGVDGVDGSSCHVEQVNKKCAKIVCDDGSSALAGNCEKEED